MKRFILCAALCGLICQATGCAGTGTSSQDNSTNEAQTAEQSQTTQSEETSSQTASDTASSEDSAASEDIGQTSEAQPTNPQPAEPQADIVGGELKEISPDNLFIDYRYISGYQGTANPDDCGTALGNAVLALKQTDDYKNAVYVLSSGKTIKEVAAPSNAEPSVSSFYEVAEGGEFNPIFYSAYIDDFDSDGRQEQFILLKFPMHFGELDNTAEEYQLRCRYYLAYCDADGSAEILDSFLYIEDIALLDYGTDKQLLFSADGVVGADDHDMLYGVVDGKAKLLYATRGGYTKWQCFLSTYGWQGFGAFMYYDTAAKEYRGIAGIVLDKEELAAMDTTDSAPYKPDEYYQATLIGGKYYCFSMGMMDCGVVCTFEDGRFTPVDFPIRTSYYHNCVLIDNIDTVIAEMQLLEDE
ncbi:MAG: hypothetical protein ACI4KA_10485 [Oscillospiraceae bacterium]